MTDKLLRAVSKMLEAEPTTPIEVFKTRVTCAKIMLDEIIGGMDTPSPQVQEVQASSSPKLKPEKERFQYLPEVKDQILVGLKIKDFVKNTLVEAPSTLPLEIDGVETTYAQAKGKPVDTIKVL